MSDTKRRNFSVTWTVVSGRDRSHLIDVQVFDRMRDARKVFAGLAPRPRQIWRHTWVHPFSTDGECRLVEEAGA